MHTTHGQLGMAQAGGTEQLMGKAARVLQMPQAFGAALWQARKKRSTAHQAASHLLHTSCH